MGDGAVRGRFRKHVRQPDESASGFCALRSVRVCGGKGGGGVGGNEWKPVSGERKDSRHKLWVVSSEKSTDIPAEASRDVAE